MSLRTRGHFLFKRLHTGAKFHCLVVFINLALNLYNDISARCLHRTSIKDRGGFTGSAREKWIQITVCRKSGNALLRCYWPWCWLLRWRCRPPSGHSPAGEVNPLDTPTLVLSPASRVFLTAGFNLSVTGQIFVKGYQVQWEGVPLTTRYISKTRLIAAVPASKLVTPGAYTVQVINPADDTLIGQQVFVVGYPKPRVTTLSPSYRYVSAPDFTPDHLRLRVCQRGDARALETALKFRQPSSV